MQATKKNKGEQTRALILETALRLFRERGYEETTMRLIAEEAGVALGNAYYYFNSKDELVHGFYTRMQEVQLAAWEGILQTEKNLKNRVAFVQRAQLGVMAPYQGMFRHLFKIAADPDNSLSPFHADTATVRDACIGRWEELVDGSDEKISPDLKRELPYLLWLYQMAVILFWIYDRSAHQVRTYKLIDLTSEIVCNLISLGSNPVLTPLRKTVLKTLASLRQV